MMHISAMLSSSTIAPHTSDENYHRVAFVTTPDFAAWKLMCRCYTMRVNAYLTLGDSFLMPLFRYIDADIDDLLPWFPYLIYICWGINEIYLAVEYLPYLLFSLLSLWLGLRLSRILLNGLMLALYFARMHWLLPADCPRLSLQNAAWRAHISANIS